MRQSSNVGLSIAQQVQAGIDVLRKGGVVAFPTDTLYGLGAGFSSPSAVLRVLEIKGRPEQMGLPLLLADIEQLPEVAADLSPEAWAMARRFWPGALTLVVRRASHISDLITGGRDTVAVRVPDHPVPRALARGFGHPITGTSANRSGQPAATTAQEVQHQLGESLDLIIDGGASLRRQESTIVDMAGPELRMLRAGAVPFEMVQRAYREQKG